MSTPALYDINALLTNPYTPIHKIRAAIKFLTRREELSEAETADLALLEKEERRVRALYRSRKPIYLPIGNGRFSLGGRPSEARLAQLKADGVDTIVTLLREHEDGCEAIGAWAASNDVHWIWCPLSAANLPTETADLAHIVTLFHELNFELKNGRSIFVHCAAGIHRTGSFTNAFLQYRGESAEQSKRTIRQLREVTAREAVPRQWAWANHVTAYATTQSNNTANPNPK